MALASILRRTSTRRTPMRQSTYNRSVRAGLIPPRWTTPSAVSLMSPANYNQRPTSYRSVGRGAQIVDRTAKSAAWRGGAVAVATMRPSAPLAKPVTYGPQVRPKLPTQRNYYDLVRPRSVSGFAAKTPTAVVLPPGYLDDVRRAAIQRGNLSSSSMRIAVDGCQPRPDDEKRVRTHRAPKTRTAKANFIPWC